ncbi:LytS/YhcK type 5TM receptor domain-containing protein [Jannaschia sp. 2305UL9-9]|uniref:LytS/YhcK type 5TM receptor domain-containing protein n=1 Tax=Jannaschia sp. 2305UL9-9 TaxID=3121638 RepID=UPI003528A355
MTWNATVIFDFALSIILLGLLAYGYGAIRRHLPGTKLAPQVLGGLFGIVAFIQMQVPLEPIPGLIVDLRAVPIVLAGAFLGLRGLLIAILIAASARMIIGGVGWVSGVGAIMIAGTIGVVWDYLTASMARRRFRALVLLGAVTPLHLIAVLLLPADVAWMFLKGAAPVLSLTYLAVVPVIGMLLERQRIAMKLEARQRAMAALDGDGVFCGPEALARGLVVSEASGVMKRGVSVIGLKLRGSGLRTALWGPEVEAVILCALRKRLEAILPDDSRVGMVRADIVLIFLPVLTEQRMEEVLADIRTETATRAFDVPGMAPVRLRITVMQGDYATIPTFARALHMFGWEKRRGVKRDELSDAVDGDRRRTSDMARLFRTADRLLEACEADRRLMSADNH